MTGDGFEQAFLSHYIVSIGFTQSNASLVFTLYGLCAGIAAWSAGVLAEMFGPRKIMMIGAVGWLFFHSLFVYFGLTHANYLLILLFYCFRAIGYPLFIYAFVVWITREVHPAKLASAMGWFWTMFMFGIGFMGSYIPSMTIPYIGELNTLWLAMIVVFAGGAIGYIALMSRPKAREGSAENSGSKLQQLSRGISLAFETRSMFLACIVLMLDPMAIFGFAVIMPFLFIDQLGFSSSEWLRVWSMMLLGNMIMNIITGAMGDKLGWMRMIRWQGCIGVAISSLLFYYLPSAAGHNLWVATGVALLHGACLAGFVPLSAVFPVLAPNEKGAAISLHNLSVGLGSCVGPAIATVVLPIAGVQGVVWTFAALYVLSAILVGGIKLKDKTPASTSADITPPSGATLAD